MKEQEHFFIFIMLNLQIETVQTYFMYNFKFYFKDFICCYFNFF